MTYKTDAIVGRLVQKIDLSQTPVPGFIMGLSGKDSIVAFSILYRAMLRREMAHRLVGIHYVKNEPPAFSQTISPGRSRRPMFERVAVPWLIERFPEATIKVEVPLGGNQDQQRWADLHLRALNSVTSHDGRAGTIIPLNQGENFWVAGTINATEHALGKYSLLAATASIQPIRSMWASDLMVAAEQLDVPQQVLDNARIPDCLCGRDELAAENIELIDAILRNDYDPAAYDPIRLKKVIDYIRTEKAQNGFRARLPYVV